MVRQRGFSLFELALSLILIGVFMGVLLDRMLDYQEALERTLVEVDENRLRLALRVRLAVLIAQNQKLDLTAVARENPMTWLDQPVAGYLGEFDAMPGELPPRSWYFDRRRGELVYRVVANRHLRTVQGAPAFLRWRVRIVEPAGAQTRDKTTIGLQFVPTEPFKWF